MMGRDLSRRAFLARSLQGFGAASLVNLLRLQAEAGATLPGGKHRKLILLWQDGGPTHHETFDPKPNAPAEFRGQLDAIQTSLPGVQFCEVLPKLAQVAHRFSVVRSLHQPSSGHVDGSHNVLTGWYGATVNNKSKYPDFASIISRVRSGVEDAEALIGASTDPSLSRGLKRIGSRSAKMSLPRYIDIGKGLHRGGPSYLGPVYGPFQIAGDPSKPDFQVQNLQITGATERLRKRIEIQRQLERMTTNDDLDLNGQLRSIEQFQQQAIDLLTGSGAASRAFDLTREKRSVRERYGLHTAGQQLLLARRLVEAGVNVVAIRFCPDGRGDYEKTMIGWDDHAVHGNIFEIMKKRGPAFDQSLSALIEDLDERGLDDEVLVVLLGEFGRTPRVYVHKGCPGREHWGPAGCAMVYGGGLKMGQVIGSTNSKGERPKDRPMTSHSLLATIYHSLGVNTKHTIRNAIGQPVPILAKGEPIRELL